MNELDDIYRDWKRNGGNQRIGSNGVPDPVIDSQFEPDFTNVRCCPDCGSMNVSMDMASNKTVCADCKGEAATPSRVDFQKKMEKEKEIELKNMEEAMKRGDTFGTVG